VQHLHDPTISPPPLLHGRPAGKNTFCTCSNAWTLVPYKVKVCHHERHVPSQSRCCVTFVPSWIFGNAVYVRFVGLMTNCLTTSVTFTQITFLLSYSLRRKVICFLVALPASTSANTPAEGNQRFHLQTKSPWIPVTKPGRTPPSIQYVGPAPRIIQLNVEELSAAITHTKRSYNFTILGLSTLILAGVYCTSQICFLSLCLSVFFLNVLLCVTCFAFLQINMNVIKINIICTGNIAVISGQSNTVRCAYSSAVNELQRWVSPTCDSHTVLTTPHVTWNSPY